MRFRIIVDDGLFLLICKCLNIETSWTLVLILNMENGIEQNCWDWTLESPLVWNLIAGSLERGPPLIRVIPNGQSGQDYIDDDHQLSFSSQAGLRADGSGRKRSPGWGVALSRDGQSANSEKFTRKYHRFHYGSGRRNITLLAVILILAPHLSYHLAFPLLSVGAAGDEGDPV